MLRNWKRRFLRALGHRVLFTEGVQERMGRQNFFYNAFKALSFNGIDGDYVEFGSCGGMTFDLAYHEIKRRSYPRVMWSFDSFEGLPASEGGADTHPEWQEGRLANSLEDFDATCAANEIPRKAFRTVKGFYNETLGEQAAGERPGNIALAYIDCDLYTSTLSVLRFLLPRLKPGMIMAFDDYHCWSSTHRSGERQAMLDIFALHPRWELVPFMQYGWHGAAFVVELRENPMPDSLDKA